MKKASANSQDLFLNQVRKENIPVTVYLINSVQLRGHVRGFDTFTILLESPGRPTQLVYKSAVTSIVPMRPVRLHDPSMMDGGRQSSMGEGGEPLPASDSSAPAL